MWHIEIVHRVNHHFCLSFIDGLFFAIIINSHSLYNAKNSLQIYQWMAHYVILCESWSPRFEWLIIMYMCSESLSKLACVPFGDSHARHSPPSTHVSRRLVYLPKPSPSLPPLFTLLPSSCYVPPAPRFNLNFAPAKPKAALRFFKVTRGAISRGDLAHLLERFRARYTYRIRHTCRITLFLLRWLYFRIFLYWYIFHDKKIALNIILIKKFFTLIYIYKLQKISILIKHFNK